MKTLVIDRDTVTGEMINARLAKLGHQATYEAVKNDGIERLAQEAFDVVFVDPAPMNDAKAMALNIKRTSMNAVYMLRLAGDETLPPYDDVIAAGCNDVLRKPIDPQALEAKVNNASNLIQFAEKLADTSEDFPSAGGVIAKSAFNQLFLSAIDRSGRYNEKTYILTIAIDNYDEIKSMDGDYNAEYSASKMASHVVNLRRMSDIIGQTGQNEYSILLQRVQKETEAIDAAKRFASSLDDVKDIVPEGGHKIMISINLLHIPSGEMPFTHLLKKYSEL
ncbi:MAG: diguanylate cyclase [Pseudomonadota bacterium]